MRPQRVANEHFELLHADMPCVVAARRVLKRRLKIVERILASLARQGEAGTRDVHQLRVATRRAAAALQAFEDFGRSRTRRSIRRLLKKGRRRAAVARQADVQLAMLRRMHDLPASRDTIAAAIGALALDRESAARKLLRATRKEPHRELRKLRRRLDGEIARECCGGAMLPNSASRQRPLVMAHLAASAVAGLTKPLQKEVGDSGDHAAQAERLHDLRIAVKRLRYATEVLSGCLPADFVGAQYPQLERLQERLGFINDLHELSLRIAGLPASSGDYVPADAHARNGNGHSRVSMPDASPVVIRDELRAVAAELERRSREAQAEFLRWWSGAEGRALVHAWSSLISANSRHGLANRPPRLNAAGRATDADTRSDTAGGMQQPGHHRVAAIDVGSNSARMVIAETHPERRFRIIEDFGETVRLASGLYQTGLISHSSMAACLDVLCQMRDLLEKHHVDRLRAVGTSALREARNADHLIRMVHKRTGINLETISGDYEARLAFSSVANAFDLSNQRVACVDLGGGSVDVVLSNGGLIESVHSLPLGAVRMTDRFSDATTPGVYRYAEMARHIDQSIREHLQAPSQPMDQMIGTGGTFTTLARISIRRAAAGRQEGRFPFDVRGYQLSLAEVSDILDWLRSLRPEQRRKVAGLSERRSEIIVAGICAIERLMRFLRVDSLHIHDGGLRDGLLMEMIDDLHLPDAAQRGDQSPALAAVRRAAQGWEYEQAHAEQVARLAVRIWDQLAEQASDAAAAWTQPYARELLEAAAVLHDVGMLVSYQRHHKHSYAMITHADLPLLSRRHVELVANIARYHRKALPSPAHRSFRRLSTDDQKLVADLAAILRVADGMDRTHTQTVSDVVVRVDPAQVTFDLHIAGEAAANLRYARRKSSLFRQRFAASVQFIPQEICRGTTGEVHLAD